MRQKFDIEGIVHKEFVLPGQTVNRTFYCDVLRRMSENIRRQPLDKWRNDSWALNHDNAPARVSLVVQHFLASTKTTVNTHPPYSPDLVLCDFFLFPKMKFKFNGPLLTALTRSRTNPRTRWRRWRKMTSNSAWDHGKPAVIAVSVHKRTTSRGMEANRNFGKWLSYSTGISGTFGYHLVCTRTTVSDKHARYH
jgi:hypothetical protein